MKISVIMLTYNRDKLVGRAIESILGQTFSDFEYILVDNGSTDQSGEICDQYAKKDVRVKVIHRERGNIGSGRNAGLALAAGDYIAFIDDDDWCDPDFLEFLYNLAVDNDADISICGATDKVFNEKHIFSAEEAVIELLRRKKFNVQFPTKLIKRELFNNTRFSERAKYDDIELMPRILAIANCVAYHGLPKYTFYRHETNNSAWTTNHSLLDSETLSEYLRVYRERTTWLCAYFPNKISAWQYFEWSFMISMVEKIVRLEIEGCGECLNTMRGELRKNRDAFLNSGFMKDFEREWAERYL